MAPVAHMNSWPMLERCLVQQWKGHEQWQRDMIDAAWEKGIPPGFGALPPETQVPIWQSVNGLRCRTLISIKYG